MSKHAVSKDSIRHVALAEGNLPAGISQGKRNGIAALTGPYNDGIKLLDFTIHFK